MSADPERLQATLDELHRQLTGLGPLDSAQRKQLSSALAEIQTILHTKARPEKSLLPRLREAARGFEGSHPALSGTIGGLIDILAGMGI